MTEWKTVKLGDICSISTGKRPLNKETHISQEYPIPVYGGNGISWFTNETLLDKPVILTGRVGTIGTLYRVKKPCWVSDNALLISPKRANFDFVFYILKLSNFTALNRGSTQPLITQTDVKNLEIPLPPLDVQKRIAGILGALDGRIDVLRRENVVLEQMAQAVFQSWFVDFDIVRAKAAGTPESEVCEKYHISPELYALFPSALTPDNLPLGWEKKNLGDISQYSKEKTTNVNIETYVSTENMLPNYGGIEKASSVPETGQSTRYKAGNVLISNIRPYFKKIWFADREGSCSNDVLVFSSNSIGKCMLYSILAQDAFFDFVMSGANGDKMPRGNKKHIMTYPVIFPNMDLLNKFENLVASLFDKKSKNAQQIRALSATRDALLPKLMNGEIEV